MPRDVSVPFSGSPLLKCLAISAAVLLSPVKTHADVAPPPSTLSHGSPAASIVSLLVPLLLPGLFLGTIAWLLLSRFAWYRRLRSGTVRVVLVVIVTLSLLGSIGYWFLLNRSVSPRDSRRLTEALSNVSAIRSTEVAYFAEWRVYVGNQPLTPVASRMGRPEKVAWDPGTRFSILGFAPEGNGNVSCSYCLEGPAWPSAAEGFTARAECDFNGDLVIFTIGAENAEIRRTVSLAPLSLATLRRWLGL